MDGYCRFFILLQITFGIQLTTVAMPNVWWIRMFDYFQVPMTCSAYFLAIY